MEMYIHIHFCFVINSHSEYFFCTNAISLTINFAPLKQRVMDIGKRQRQVGKLIMEEMSDILQREGVNIIEGGMVSITKVMITPDLLEARIYLSFYQIKDPITLLHKITDRGWEFRKLLGQRVKNQLRRVPEIQFYIDDTLDHVFKMEEIFKKIGEEREGFKSNQAAE